MNHPTVVKRPNPVLTAQVAGTMHYVEEGGRTACGRSVGIGRWSDRGKWPWRSPWGVSASPCSRCLKKRPVMALEVGEE